MGPAETLRKAAALVREKAKFATDGPWTCSPVWSPDSGSTSGVYSHAHPTGTIASEVVASGRVRSGYGGIRNPHNAVWITLMQPAIAEPLAAVLEEAAGRLEFFLLSTPAEVALPTVEDELALARALLGEEATR